jgi:D-amino peptidase
MRVVLSAEMESVAQITDVRDLACRREYWDAGRRKLTEDVVAAATGLLEGGASEVILLDNHGSGNPWNVLMDQLPDGVRGRCAGSCTSGPGCARSLCSSW